MAIFSLVYQRTKIIRIFILTYPAGHVVFVSGLYSWVTDRLPQTKPLTLASLSHPERSFPLRAFLFVFFLELAPSPHPEQLSLTLIAHPEQLSSHAFILPTPELLQILALLRVPSPKLLQILAPYPQAPSPKAHPSPSSFSFGSVKLLLRLRVVYTSWAPQMKILGHESVGGFLTHAGTSSVVEAVQEEKPLVLLPFLADQGLYARALEEKKMAYVIQRDDRTGGFTSESVAESLKLVIIEEEGKIYREKIKEMKDLFANGNRQRQSTQLICNLCNLGLF